jgi:hypothetical protein
VTISVTVTIAYCCDARVGVALGVGVAVTITVTIRVLFACLVVTCTEVGIPLGMIGVLDGFMGTGPKEDVSSIDEEGEGEGLLDDAMEDSKTEVDKGVDEAAGVDDATVDETVEIGLLEKLEETSVSDVRTEDMTKEKTGVDKGKVREND